MKNGWLLAFAIAIVSLPFVARRWALVSPLESVPSDADRLVIISAHNEAIRQEFDRAFRAWHRDQTGRPIRIDWLVIGGTTEISRYLNSEYVAAVRAWWTRQGRPWPAGAAAALLDPRFPQQAPPADRPDAERQRWRELSELHAAFRATDDPAAFTTRIDLFFGGGQYDHARAYGQGMTTAPWPPDAAPPGLFHRADGTEAIPEQVSGEIWRADAYFGTVVSTFGICYNADRIRQLGLDAPPSQWEDLADPRYIGQIAVADPTKSGSIAKAFEMIVHQQVARAVRRAGFSDAQVEEYEKLIRAAGLPRGDMPPQVPPAYQAAVEEGWMEGLRLVRSIGANARYFTDSAGKVVMDVAQGQAAAGLAIDFFARYQAEVARAPDGAERMFFVTPRGGSSVSADPISLLRGAPHRAAALRFIEFALREEGQRLWTYRAGTPGGPVRFTLRRLPIRRDFYPSEQASIQAAHERHRALAADDLASPGINPYVVAGEFHYRARWTSAHFGVHRDLIRAMCMDSARDLRAAWAAIHAQGGPDRQPAAMEALERMPGAPYPVTWRTAPEVLRQNDRHDVLREWTLHFRAAYREALARVVPVP